MEKYKVRFYPADKVVEVEKDKTILSAAISAGVYIGSVCGGDGVCGRCKVVVNSGRVLMPSTAVLTAEERQKGIYLACLAAVQSDLEVTIPLESSIDYEKPLPQENLRLKGLYSEVEEVESLKPAVSDKEFSFAPLTVKEYLRLPKPDLEDKISDLERVCRQIKYLRKDAEVVQSGIANIRSLSGLLRDSDWNITVTLTKHNRIVDIILIEPDDTSKENFGFCFDIGTTTISGQLVDLNTKKIIGTKAAYNRQASFGSDVISRIVFASEPAGLEKLHYAVTETMNQIIQELIFEHSIDLNNVTSVVCAGNTTMIHLLLRIDPAYIRKEPYVPTANFLPLTRPAEAGVKINPHGVLYCIPGVSSYVGADITAGVLSTGMSDQDDLSVLIDIGTNGEIVLGNKEFLFACAASAGPAFEGSGISSGMRAAKGAIQKARISPVEFALDYRTIGDTRPRGVCGSGYIDILSQLLLNGIIDKNGKIKQIAHKRIRDGRQGREFVVAFKEETDSGCDIVITEADIENLKRAKAAIYSATASLLRHLDIQFRQIKKIFVAGGFGNYIDVDSAVNIGLLPDINRERFVFVGNSSLSGSRYTLLSAQAARLNEEIARKITYFELSVEPGYMDEYTAALFFPHTDLNRFPSVNPAARPCVY